MSKEIDEQAQALLYLHAYKTLLDEKKKQNGMVRPIIKSTRRSRLLAGIGNSLVTIGQRMERRFSEDPADAIRFDGATGE
jgi:hypothetical protein